MPKLSQTAPTPQNADKTKAPEYGADLPASPLARLRLLIALDAILVEGSVTGAARALGLGVPAMSRLLAQIRLVYDDPIFVRSGRSLTPTPLAEQLRMRVRAVSAEASHLMQPQVNLAKSVHKSTPTSQLPIIQHPPLAMNPTPLVEGQPDLAVIAHRLAEIGDTATPKQRLAGYIATVGSGVGQSRPLTLDEAADAMGIILDGDADPVQIGALLVVLQYRSVTANELAGMVRAARRECIPLNAKSPVVDLDWPAYRSPRVTTPPWFLLAARLVAQAGFRVALHGMDGFGSFHHIASGMGIEQCMSLAEAQQTLQTEKIVFLPLTAINPQIQALISLYRLFEMRSPINLVTQLLNPLGARATIIGVPSAAGRSLQRDTAAALGWNRLTAIGSNRDVAQATPFQTTPLAFLDGTQSYELSLSAQKPKLANPYQRAGLTASEYCLGVWSGQVRDEHAVATIISTAAIALMSLSPDMPNFETACEQARNLWNDRKVGKGF